MEKRETTLMASSIYRAAAQDSEAKIVNWIDFFLEEQNYK